VGIEAVTRILVVSATTGYQLRSFGDAAERLGFELMFATDRCHRLDDPWRDHAVAVRFHEPDASVAAIVRAAEERAIDGVIAVGDRPTVLAAQVASALRLPGNPPEAARASTNKRVTRERLAGAGLLAPWFFTMPLGDAGPLATGDPRLSTTSRLHAAPLRPAFPCVVKPLGLSGSRGVIRANTPAELDAALARVGALLTRKDVRALRSGMEDEVLIEGYIDGAEVAIEGVLTAGDLQILTIFDKPDPLDGPFFEETIYLTPSSLPPDQQRQIAMAVADAAAALGLRHGPIHAECRLAREGVFVLEIAARPIGGLCSRVLRFGAGDVSLEEVLLRHAAGEDVTAVGLERQAAGVMMIPIPKRGLLKRFGGEAEARAVPGIEDVRITAKPDQLLEPLPEAGSYLGFIFARGSERAAVDAALRQAHRELHFVIDAPIPVQSSGQ
jgi:biotin carboxylase